VNLLFEAQSDPDLNVVWEWFELQGQLIASERRRFRLFFQGLVSSDDLDAALENRFRGLNRVEVEDAFENQRRELELLTMLGLLATAEAILRNDFERRVARRLKDGLSRKYRTIAKRKKRTRLDEDLLEILKQEVTPSIVSDFRGALRLRHWLAHGRYWHPKLGRPYSAREIVDISKAVVEALPV
jgi:hypothetical protein